MSLRGSLQFGGHSDDEQEELQINPRDAGPAPSPTSAPLVLPSPLDTFTAYAAANGDHRMDLEAVEQLQREKEEEASSTIGDSFEGVLHQHDLDELQDYRDTRLIRSRKIPAEERIQSAVPSTTGSDSQDASFPRQIPRSTSLASIASSTFPRRPFAHPQISRLRSTTHQQQQQTSQQQHRFASASSHTTFVDRNESTSAFDLQSRRSSVSNLHDVAASDSLLLEPPTTSSLDNPVTLLTSTVKPSDTLKWSTLRRVSSQIYSPFPAPPSASQNEASSIAGTSTGLIGLPTVLAASGIIVVGTDQGWVGIFDFAQNLLSICGTESLAKESGAVTALAISQDHTFIAVGHSRGFIHLYSLAKPHQPTRSVAPTTLSLVIAGRKEGHLIGSRILHLGFVGARHTSIVSSDDAGLAFFHSLGKVLMLASTDIVRMLGKYPEPNAATLSSSSSSSPIPSDSAPIPPLLNGTLSRSKKPSIIFGMAPLPLGPSPHASDHHALVALLTPSKLVIVGLKPTPRTWWRATPVMDATINVSVYSSNGVMAWYPSVLREGVVQVSANGSGAEQEGEDPILAFAWGKNVRIVRVKKEGIGSEEARAMKGGVDIKFVESDGWSCDEPVLALQWYTQRIICVLTSNHVDVYDTLTRQTIGRDRLDTRTIVCHPPYAFSASLPTPLDSLTYSASFKIYKRRIFLLTVFDLRAGAVLSWADRILALMRPGSILEAIDTMTSYLLGHTDASTIGLPDDLVERRVIVEPKLREILAGSLDFVFSEDRLRDGSHNDGEKMQQLFKDLVATCVRACLATDDIDWLFEDLYERYEHNGIEAIFLEQIEPFVLSGSVHALPPSVSQRLISIHDELGQYEAAQRIIWHVDPEALDINQVLGLCQRQRLFDAMIYVYNRSMNDYVSPLVELIALVRRIQQHRQQRPQRIGDDSDQAFIIDDEQRQEKDADVETTVQDAYKVYAYLSQALSGLSYPSRTALAYEAATTARNSLYHFIFSKRMVRWPAQGGGKVLATDAVDQRDATYPYLRLLLRFDSEAMLDTLDLAFEESFLEDDIANSTIDRQRIVEILIDVISPQSDDFSSNDLTFLHIFVARNLPKYPQYIQLPSATLHRILIGLATDDDQSTTEDRQLAAEYLLSTFTPHDGPSMIALFEQASFFRILRSIYKGERRWAALASTYLRDIEVTEDVFIFLRETLRLASLRSSRTSSSDRVERERLEATILDNVSSLIQSGENGLRETAELIDDFLSTRHADVIRQLDSTPWRQFAYLRYLLEPTSSDESSHYSSFDRTPSTNLDGSQHLLYLSLLCAHESSHLISYLEAMQSRSDVEDVAVREGSVQIFEENKCYDALIWTLDARGDTEEALSTMEEVLDSSVASLLLQLAKGSSSGDRGDVIADVDLEQEGDEAIDSNQLGSAATIETYLEQISSVADVSTAVCSRRAAVARPAAKTNSAEMTGEDLWFRLLSSLVSTVGSIRAVSPLAPTLFALDPTRRRSLPPISKHSRRKSTDSVIYLDNDDNLEDESSSTLLSPRSTELLSSLIPNALSSLVATTSSRTVSFPALVRRLIESRTQRSTTSYASEFKTIITSMLNSYIFAGDLLTLASNIVVQDLFEFVDALKEGRERGWRAGEGKGRATGMCEECKRVVWGESAREMMSNGARNVGGGSSNEMTRNASMDLIESLTITERPRMGKRPSLKGKEVEWVDHSSEMRRNRDSQSRQLNEVLDAPRGIVIGRDGQIWHEICHLRKS